MEGFRTPRPRRPRPVADAPVDVLVAGASIVAKGWLLELLDTLPLQEAGELPAGTLAQDGPPLLEALARALASDAELNRLGEGGDLERLAARAGAMTGARTPPETIHAVEVLRGVLVAAVRALDPSGDRDFRAEIDDRIAYVCTQIALAALAQLAMQPEAPEAVPPSNGHDTLGRAAPLAPVTEPESECVAAGPLWQAALERQLSDGDRLGRRFALLLVEVDGAERIRLAEPSAAPSRFDRVAQAVRSSLRRADVMAQEEGGRIWVIVSDAGRSGADALAARIAQSVQSSVSARGVPLTASVGVAVFPEDGTDSASLSAEAEESAFAARAAGVQVGNGAEQAPGPRSVPGPPPIVR